MRAPKSLITSPSPLQSTSVLLATKEGKWSNFLTTYSWVLAPADPLFSLPAPLSALETDIRTTSTGPLVFGLPQGLANGEPQQETGGRRVKAGL